MNELKRRLPGKKGFLSAQDREELVRLYEQGVPVSEISQRLKVSGTTLYYNLPENASFRVKRYHHLTEQDILELRNRYIRGDKISNIKKDFKIGNSSIYWHLRDLPARNKKVISENNTPIKPTKKYPKRTVLSNNDCAAIHYYFKSRMPFEEIAKIYDLHTSSVLKVLSSKERTTRPHVPDKEPTLTLLKEGKIQSKQLNIRSFHINPTKEQTMPTTTASLISLHGKPTQKDQHPLGTQALDLDERRLYVQVNSNKSDPIWIPLHQEPKKGIMRKISGFFKRS